MRDEGAGIRVVGLVQKGVEGVRDDEMDEESMQGSGEEQVERMEDDQKEWVLWLVVCCSDVEVLPENCDQNLIVYISFLALYCIEIQISKAVLDTKVPSQID